MKNLLTTLTLVCACMTAYTQNADSSQFYFTKAMQEKQAGKFLVASSNFDRAIKFNAANAEAYVQNGYTHLEMKRTDAALKNFTTAYSLQPNNKKLVKELADLYFSYRQFANAIEFAKKCAECENSLRIMGMSYYQQEDYVNAEIMLSAAIAKDPNDAQATYTMGRNLLDMEEYRKAIPFYNKAVKLDETKNVWMYELGLLYYNLDDFKNALSSFKNAADHGYIQSGDFKENLGYASLYSGEYDNGETLLLAVWKARPANKDILRDMSEIFYKQKQYDRSLAYCQKLIELDPKDGKALYQAGMCFQKKGEKDRGQQMCDKAIEMDPSLDGLRKKKEISGI
ncbi:MAG: tetratricopeptide repeat protein [Ferruginibacter sp.]